MFGDGQTFGGIPGLPNYASNPQDQDTYTVLNYLFAKISENSKAVESMKRHFAPIESLASLTSQVSIMRASYKLFNKHVCQSL